jgi:hypothetical protein
MSKIIETVVYSFEELPQNIQKKVIEKNGDINTMFDWWEFNYESFNTLCEFFGIKIRTKEKNIPVIYFQIGYCQSDFSGFEGYLSDFEKLVKCCQNQSWKKEFPTLEINGLPSFNYKFIDNYFEAITEGSIEINVTSSVNRYMSIETSSNVNNNLNAAYDMLQIEKDVKNVFQTLNRLLFNGLKESLEYLESEDAIKETLIKNEYTFTIDGEMMNG